VTERDSPVHVEIFIDDKWETGHRFEDRSAACVSEDLGSNRSTFLS